MQFVKLTYLLIWFATSSTCDIISLNTRFELEHDKKEILRHFDKNYERFLLITNHLFIGTDWIFGWICPHYNMNSVLQMLGNHNKEVTHITFAFT